MTSEGYHPVTVRASPVVPATSIQTANGAMPTLRFKRIFTTKARRHEGDHDFDVGDNLLSPLIAARAEQKEGFFLVQAHS